MTKKQFEDRYGVIATNDDVRKWVSLFPDPQSYVDVITSDYTLTKFAGFAGRTGDVIIAKGYQLLNVYRLSKGRVATNPVGVWSPMLKSFVLNGTSGYRLLDADPSLQMVDLGYNARLLPRLLHSKVLEEGSYANDVVSRLLLLCHRFVSDDGRKGKMYFEESVTALLTSHLLDTSFRDYCRNYIVCNKKEEGLLNVISGLDHEESGTFLLNMLLKDVSTQTNNQILNDCNRYGYPEGWLGDALRKKELWHMY
jgi:hypothetical protein